MKQIEFKNITYKYPESDVNIFTDFSLIISTGVTSLIGQNGTGKTTLLLLASGLILPQSGQVLINGVDTADLQDLQKRQKLVSFIYQNMEFETNENISILFEYILENGFHKNKDKIKINELVDKFDIAHLLDKTTQKISKGELQKVIIVFSLLYGSEILIMDEPIFALEDQVKYKIMGFLVEYCKKNGVSLIYSAHEIDISKKFSEFLILFHKNHHIESGLTNDIFTVKKIEEAYNVPFDTLKQKEAFFRESLV